MKAADCGSRSRRGSGIPKGPAFRLSKKKALARAVLATIFTFTTPTEPLSAQPITEIIDSTGDGTNALHGPGGVAVDSAGNVYVAGAFSNNVFKITRDGTTSQIIDSAGDGTNDLAGASGVAVDGPGNVYVAGAFSNNVFKIAPDGAITQIIDSTGDGANGLETPSGIAVDGTDNVYVAGEGYFSGNVFKITPGGTITQIIDSTGDGTNALRGASGVAVDSADNVYVAGSPPSYAGEPPAGNAFKITPGGTITQIIDSTGDGTNALYAPRGVAVDSAGNVYVTGFDSYNVFKIAPDGAITQIIDSAGDGTNDLAGASRVAVDGADNVYVSAAGSDNVFKITPGGTITQIIDSSGDGTNGLDEPRGVAVDGADNVYVAGSGSNNVFKIAATRIVGTGTPESCTEAALDAALAGGGLVTFDCGAEPATIVITSSMEINQDTTIEGNDDNSRITISGVPFPGFSVFAISSGVTFHLRNLTVANAFAGISGSDVTVTVTNSIFSGNEWGIFVFNTDALDLQLTVTNSVFSGNGTGGSDSGIGSGGGIAGGSCFSSCVGPPATVTNSIFTGNATGIYYKFGTLTVANSTFANNSTGGIESTETTIAITNSTFSDNSAVEFGGGIRSYGGTLEVINSTLFANSAGTSGGGIYKAGGTLAVTNSTFSGNSAERGGGVFARSGGTLRVANTIVAHSTSGGDCVTDGFTVLDGGHNLIEDAENACDLTNGVNGNIVGVDPLLDPEGLQDNGGLTQTIALLTDSPAIDAGDPEVCADPPVNGLDQRGYIRPGTGSTTCSIGAYEFDSPGPPLPCTGDCDENGVVKIHELVALLNIGLGIADVSGCEAADRNSDGEISINEIVTAVSYSLAGCPLDPVAQTCVDSGGELTTGLCCLTTGDFPDTCAIGPCGCPPDGSHEVRLCDCGEGMCFDGSECVER